MHDLTVTEETLIKKKSEMSKFQVEYTEAVKKYKEVVERLKNETEEINSLLKVTNLKFLFQIDRLKWIDFLLHDFILLLNYIYLFFLILMLLFFNYIWL